MLSLRTSRIPRWDTRAIRLINVQSSKSRSKESRGKRGMRTTIDSSNQRLNGTWMFLAFCPRKISGHGCAPAYGRLPFATERWLVSNSVNSVCITHFSSISMGLVHSVAYASLAPNREQHYEADFYTLRWNEALAVI